MLNPSPSIGLRSQLKVVKQQREHLKNQYALTGKPELSTLPPGLVASMRQAIDELKLERLDSQVIVCVDRQRHFNYQEIQNLAHRLNVDTCLDTWSVQLFSGHQNYIAVSAQFKNVTPCLLFAFDGGNWTLKNFAFNYRLKRNLH